MCGIICVWNREAVFPTDVYDILFREAESRGLDGFGYAIVDKEMKKFTSPYTTVRSDVLKTIEDNISINDVVLGITRAQPETEVDTSIKDMQPIVKEDIYLIHNGAVSEKSVTKFADIGYVTNIDSEAIINAYISKSKNMKKTMENLIGGFAFILYDGNKKRMYCVNDFKPLAVAYFKGYGFIAHSSLTALKKVGRLLNSVDRCGVNVWEDYYYHWQKGYSIREIDLDSGIQKLYTYSPNFYHPVWNRKKDNGKELCLVICSGGVDSGLTAYILKLVGYDVKLVHFSYGQKSEEAEKLAVEKLAEKLNVGVYFINLTDFYNTIDDQSMLIKEEIDVTTGSKEDIKTTAAWVAARNLLFLAKTAAIAEAEIIKYNWKKVWIASGMSNLSEEGFYPDNSEYFIDTFFETIKFGCITWERIGYLPLLKNIMKYEEWALGEKLKFPFELTCSCDQPVVKEGELYLCKDCGSTRLSIFAARMAGVKDPRKFYWKGSTKRLIGFKAGKRKVDVEKVINRLILPKERKEKLRRLLVDG